MTDEVTVQPTHSLFGRGHTIPANRAIERIGHTETLFIDLRKE